MKASDAVGMVCIVAGLALGNFAWSVREYWWGIGAALLGAGGVWILCTREREHRIARVEVDVRHDGSAWRLGRRRNDGEDTDRDVGSFDAADD